MNKSLVIGIVAAVVGLFLLGGIFLWQQSELALEGETAITEQEEEKLEEQESENIGTSNWQTYRNEELEIEFEYPSIVATEEVSDSGILLLRTDKPCEFEPAHRCPVFMWIAVESGIEEDIRSYISQRYSLQQFEEFLVSQREAKGGFSVDMIRAVQFGTEDLAGWLVHNWAQSTGVCTYYAKREDRVGMIERSAVGLVAEECDEDLLFSEILSTFRFFE